MKKQFDISETKLWLIQEIIGTNNPKLLEQLRDVLLASKKIKEYKYSKDTELKLVKEPEVLENYTNSATDNYPLSEEQEERLMKELDEAEEDVKAGRVYSHEEVKAYFKIKMAIRKK